jgi:hypothetical protein
MQDPNQPVNEPTPAPVAPHPPVMPPSNVPPVPGTPGQSQVLGVLAMVAGILAFLTGFFWFLSIPLGVAALVLGILSIKKNQGKGMGIAGLVTGIIGLLFGLGILLFTVLLVTSPEVRKSIDEANTTSSTSTSSTGSWDAAAAYGKVTTGMSKAQVETATGKSSENCVATESSYGKTETCNYGNSFTDGASISVTYTDDKVSSKSKY